MEPSEGGAKLSLDESGKAMGKASTNASEALDVAIDLLEDVQRVIGKGRARMVKIKFGDRVIAQVPVALTAAAAFAAGLAAVLLTKLAIEVEHED